MTFIAEETHDAEQSLKEEESIELTIYSTKIDISLASATVLKNTLKKSHFATLRAKRAMFICN